MSPRPPPPPADLSAMLDRHERYLARRSGGTRLALAHCDLRDVDFSGRDLREADFSGATLVHASLAKSDLRDATLFAADLRLADLTDADLSQADLRGCTLRQADFTRARMIRAKLGPGWIAAFNDGDLVLVAGTDRPVDASGGLFRAADLTGAKLERGRFLKADLRDAVLRNVDLTGADLTGALLSNAQLDGAILSGAVLVEARMHGVVAIGTRTSNSVFTNADFLGAVIDEPLRRAAVGARNIPQPGVRHERPIDEALALHQLWLDSDGAEGRQLQLYQADLREIPLRGLNLKQIVLNRCDLSGANLRGLHAPGIDLTGSRLDGCDLIEANFCGSILDQAIFTEAKLCALDLRPWQHPVAGLTPTVARSTRFWRADLTSARFDWALLEEVDFAGSILSGAVFDGAELKTVHFRGALDAAQLAAKVKAANAKK